MKKLMIAGAMLGFLTGVLFGLVNGAAWPDILSRATFASVAAGYLFKWWGRVWLQALQQAHTERFTASQLHHAPPANV